MIDGVLIFPQPRFDVPQQIDPAEGARRQAPRPSITDFRRFIFSVALQNHAQTSHDVGIAGVMESLFVGESDLLSNGRLEFLLPDFLERNQIR